MHREAGAEVRWGLPAAADARAARVAAAVAVLRLQPRGSRHAPQFTINVHHAALGGGRLCGVERALMAVRLA